MASATIIGNCSMWRSVTTTLGVDGDVGSQRWIRSSWPTGSPSSRHGSHSPVAPPTARGCRRAIDLFDAHRHNVDFTADADLPAGITEIRGPLRPGLTVVLQVSGRRDPGPRPTSSPAFSARDHEAAPRGNRAADLTLAGNPAVRTYMIDDQLAYERRERPLSQ